MRTKWVLFLAAGLSGIGLATLAALAQGPNLQPAVASLTGTLHIQQGVPCNPDIDLTTPVTDGRLELAPAEGLDVAGGKFFTLTRLSVSFAPFSVHRECGPFGATKNYTEESVELGRTVSFTASPSTPGVYAFTIPKTDFQIYLAAIVNDTLDAGYKRPSEDVTGTIDLTLGTVQMHAVVATRVHFDVACLGDDCFKDGTLTVDLSGTIVFPDADGDGVPDRIDNCKLVPNPDQTPVPTPVVTAPSGITLASCADQRIGAARAADVCDGGPVSVTNDAPGTFAPGINIVTWRGEDTTHRIGITTQNVTVVDTTPPIFTFVPPNVAMNSCGPANLLLPAATDDCAGTPAFTNNAPASFGVGATVVTWTASDASGNHATATQTVTVLDTVAPTVSCVAAGPPGGTFKVSATDACTNPPASLPPVIRLGSFVLANGERIKINETGQSGVTLIGTVGPDHIRHFHVGKGEAIITATDASNNVGSAVCR